MKELVTFRKYLNEGIINEELTPIQQYVYDYEIEVSGEDMAKDFLDSIEKLKTPQDVYDYYSIDRGWEDDDLENIYKQWKNNLTLDEEI